MNHAMNCMWMKGQVANRSINVPAEGRTGAASIRGRIEDRAVQHVSASAPLQQHHIHQLRPHTKNEDDLRAQCEELKPSMESAPLHSLHDNGCMTEAADLPQMPFV